MKHAIGPDVKPIVEYNQNPNFDTRKYEVELLDGLLDEYCHNILLENSLSQVDEYGRELILMNEISYHKINKSAIRE